MIENTCAIISAKKEILRRVVASLSHYKNSGELLRTLMPMETPKFLAYVYYSTDCSKYSKYITGTYFSFEYIPCGKDTTSKLKIRSAKEIRYFSSQTSAVQFIFNRERVFTDFQARD